MSLLARIGRAVQVPRLSEPDGATSYGMAGEALARDLMDRDGYFAVYNRIVPHPEQEGRFLEADAIIYAEGSLFCVEVKRYRGTLEWSHKGFHNQRYRIVRPRSSSLYAQSRSPRLPRPKQ